METITPWLTPALLIGLFTLLWRHIAAAEHRTEKHFEVITKRFDETNRRIDETNRRIDETNREINKRFDNMNSEMNKRFDDAARDRGARRQKGRDERPG